MSYFVYIIRSTNGRHYIGYTGNLEQRLSQHNRRHHGFTDRISEKWELVIYLEVPEKKEAMKIESHLKSLKNVEKALRYLEYKKSSSDWVEHSDI